MWFIRWTCKVIVIVVNLLHSDLVPDKVVQILPKNQGERETLRFPWRKWKRSGSIKECNITVLEPCIKMAIGDSLPYTLVVVEGNSRTNVKDIESC